MFFLKFLDEMKVKSFFKYLALLLFLFSGAQEFYAQTQGRLGSARRQFGDACVAPNKNGVYISIGVLPILIQTISSI